MEEQMVFNFSSDTILYTCRICKEVRWKEIPKCVCALEDRVHIASNILRVLERFFSNEEVMKFAKMKYENRPINFSRTNEHLSWYRSRLRSSRKVVSSIPRKSVKKKKNNSKSYIHYVIRIALVTPCLSTPVETAWLTGGNAKFLKLFRSESY